MYHKYKRVVIQDELGISRSTNSLSDRINMIKQVGEGNWYQNNSQFHQNLDKFNKLFSKRESAWFKMNQ